MRDAARNTRAREQAFRRARSEDGFSLIELLVALTVFAMILLGVAATVDTGMTLVRNNRNRSVAANLAAQEMDRIRSDDFLTLAAGTATETVDGVDYAVTRELTWVPRDATVGPCDGGSGDPALLRVRVSVRWDSMRGVDPVVSDTVLSPPVGAFDPDTGHIAVKVLDREARPSFGTLVTATGPEIHVLTTNSDGCAFFGYLAPGTYTVSLGTAGFVDRQGDDAPEQTAGVQIGAVASVQFDYDRAAELELELVPEFGGTVPDGIPVTIANSQLLPVGTRVYDGTGALRSIDGLFPALDGYEMFAGGCADADPAGSDLDGGAYWPDAPRADALTTSPGGSSAGEVVLDTVTVAVLDGDGLPVAGVDVYATHDADHVCPEGEGYLLGTTDVLGEVTVGLPYGTWTLSVPSRTPAAGTWPEWSLDPTATGAGVAAVEVAA